MWTKDYKIKENQMSIEKLKADGGRILNEPYILPLPGSQLEEKSYSNLTARMESTG